MSKVINQSNIQEINLIKNYFQGTLILGLESKKQSNNGWMNDTTT